MTTERIDVLGWVREASKAIDTAYGPQAQLPREAAAVASAVAELIAATSSLLDNLEAWNEAPATGFPQHDFTRVCRALARVGVP